MKNLWPEKFYEPHDFAPKQLLEEQASLLHKITEGIVSAEVEVVAPNIASKVFENPGPFCFGFTIVGPFIDNYKYRVLRLTHGVPMYPVTVWVDSEIGKELTILENRFGMLETVSTPEAFERMVTSVLKSNRLKEVIGTIIALSR